MTCSLVPKEVNAMYATRLMTDIYHLVQPGGQHTLCGLRISRVTTERKANMLQLVRDLESDFTICKHCERISGQDLEGQ
jgi:hypothetical protein